MSLHLEWQRLLCPTLSHTPISSSTENLVSHENNLCQIPGDWGRGCPLGTLEGIGFLGQLQASHVLIWDELRSWRVSECIQLPHQQLTGLRRTSIQMWDSGICDPRATSSWWGSLSPLFSLQTWGDRCAFHPAQPFGELCLTKANGRHLEKPLPEVLPYPQEPQVTVIQSLHEC